MPVALRIDASGSVIQTYAPVTSGTLFNLVLDPDGTSFWLGEAFSGDVFRLDIATGTALFSFNTAPLTRLLGLAIFTGSAGVGPPKCANLSATLVGTNGSDTIAGTSGPATSSLPWAATIP